MLGFQPIAAKPFASADVISTPSAIIVASPALLGALLLGDGVFGAATFVVKPFVNGTFQAFTGAAFGSAILNGAVASSFAALSGSAAGYTGSLWRPTRIIPSWVEDGTTVIFNSTDVPLLGNADDSRQVLMALLSAWADEYNTAERPPQKTRIRYEPFNVSAKGNFVWASVVFERVTAGSEEVLPE